MRRAEITAVSSKVIADHEAHWEFVGNNTNNDRARLRAKPHTLFQKGRGLSQSRGARVLFVEVNSISRQHWNFVVMSTKRTLLGTLAR